MPSRLWSFPQQTIDVIPEFLYDAPEQMADLFRRMWPLDPSYIKPTLRSLIETLHIATVGTVIAIVLAIPVGLLAARNVTSNLPLNLLAVCFQYLAFDQFAGWALCRRCPRPRAAGEHVRFGAVRSGFVASCSPRRSRTNQGSIEALTAAGASKLSTLCWALAAVRPAFWSIALFRWDINIRESAVLELVGAGGIGVALFTALNLLYWDQVAVVLLAIFVVVIVAEIIVTMVRAKVL